MLAPLHPFREKGERGGKLEGGKRNFMRREESRRGMGGDWKQEKRTGNEKGEGGKAIKG